MNDFTLNIDKSLIVKNVFDDKGNFIEQRILMPNDKDYEREYQAMLKERGSIGLGDININKEQK